MSQLFPVKIKHTIPSPFPSADVKEFAIGEDGMDYAVKSGLTAACEALCYKTFTACSIAVPQNAILEMLDGSTAFGSRVIIDKTYDVASPAEKLQWFRDCSAIMSSICGLDHMLANEDRHQGNFLYLTGLNNRKTCMAIDFSRALLFRGWPLTEIWTFPNNTTNMVVAKKNIGTWDVAAATQSLLILSSIKKETWESWVNDLPSGWLDISESSKLIDWWNSGEFQSRIQKCMIAVQ
jgi:hypothetical protein